MRKGALDLNKGRIGTLATLAAALVIWLAAAPGASAATTCDYDPGLGLINVQMTAEGDSALFKVGPSGEIQIRNNGPVLTCTGGDPTVLNTDNVIVADTSDNPL